MKLWIFTAILAFSAAAQALGLPRSAVEVRSFESSLVSQRRVQYRVILPKGFDSANTYPVVYFLHGRDSSSQMLENLGVLPLLDQLVDAGYPAFLIVSPEGGNSYWMNAAKIPEMWEDVVTEDLIQDVESHYPQVSRVSKDRLLAGISMGGASAVRIALHRPEIYGAIAAHSPVFRNEQEANKDFPEIFGQGKDYQERDPFSLIESGNYLHSPLRMDAGNTQSIDVQIGRARLFAKKIQLSPCFAHFADVQGKHDGAYWTKHLPEYLRWYSDELSGQLESCH